MWSFLSHLINDARLPCTGQEVTRPPFALSSAHWICVESNGHSMLKCRYKQNISVNVTNTTKFFNASGCENKVVVLVELLVSRYSGEGFISISSPFFTINLTLDSLHNESNFKADKYMCLHQGQKLQLKIFQQWFFSVWKGTKWNSFLEDSWSKELKMIKYVFLNNLGKCDLRFNIWICNSKQWFWLWTCTS